MVDPEIFSEIFEVMAREGPMRESGLTAELLALWAPPEGAAPEGDQR